jgi:putative permease
MKRLIQISLTITGTLLLFLLVWVFRPTLALLGGSLAISAALRPLVQRLEDLRIGRGVAILIWYLLILAGLMIGGMIYGIGLTNEISAAAERLPRFYEAMVAAWQQGSRLEQMLARGLPDFGELLRGLGDAGGLALAGGALMVVAQHLVGDLLFLFAALSLAYYWLIEATHFERLWLSLLPVGARVRARGVWRNTESAVGAYIRSTVVAVTVAGLFLLMVYTLVDLPFRSLLALLGGVAHIIPSLGPALGLLPALLVALTISPLESAIVLGGGLLVQIIAQQIAKRMLKAQAVKVNPLLQVVVILALADLSGFLAIVFGPPLAATIQVLYANVLALAVSSQPRESAFELLAERLGRLRAGADPQNVELASVLRRSEHLLGQARGLLKDGENATVR